MRCSRSSAPPNPQPAPNSPKLFASPLTDSTAWIDPESATSLFYADCPPDAAARAVELVRPDTALNFALSPTAAEWKCTPSLYIATRRDRTWPPSLADKFAQRCTNVVSLDTGHSPYLSAPDLTASIIRDCL